VVNPSVACLAEGDALGVISDIAPASLAGVTANISNTTAATLRPRTRPCLECATPVMVEVSLNAGGDKRFSPSPAWPAGVRVNSQSPEA
jgi:hypothetical protein